MSGNLDVSSLFIKGIRKITEANIFIILAAKNAKPTLSLFVLLISKRLHTTKNVEIMWKA